MGVRLAVLELLQMDRYGKANLIFMDPCSAV
jgi:hypothetical protein